MTLKETLELMMERRNLTEAQASELMVALTDTSVAPAMAGALLAAMRTKGVTADELRGFAKSMRTLARRPVLSAGTPLVDMVGTGGDGSGSFNLSTGAALLVAAMGIRVDGNVYEPMTVASLGWWPDTGGFITTIAGLRDKLGWEYAGRIGTVVVP